MIWIGEHLNKWFGEQVTKSSWCLMLNAIILLAWMDKHVSIYFIFFSLVWWNCLQCSSVPYNNMIELCYSSCQNTFIELFIKPGSRALCWAPEPHYRRQQRQKYCFENTIHSENKYIEEKRLKNGRFEDRLNLQTVWERAGTQQLCMCGSGSSLLNYWRSYSVHFSHKNLTQC